MTAAPAAADPLSGVPNIERIVADCDLDGLMATAVLKMVYPKASVYFAHPARMREPEIESIININTAICDLPFHPNCGLWLDHHLTNKPTSEEKREHSLKGGKSIWEPLDSAARVAYELFRTKFDLSALGEMMDMVDKIDSGRLTPDEFLDPDATTKLSRTIGLDDTEYVLKVLDWLVACTPLEEIMMEPEVIARVNAAEESNRMIIELLPSKGKIIDRIGIARLEDTGLGTNGFLFTAYWGDDVDAVCVVKGYLGGDLDDSNRPPYSVSFYNNSFLHGTNGVMDLTRLATKLDATGGGHANACGCRIMAIDDSQEVVKRPVTKDDIDRNIAAWLEEWRHGRSPLKD